MRSLYFLSTVMLMSALSCKQPETAQESKPVKLITLDPGHFHAALVQKSMYPQVDSTVYVYAPKDGEDLQAHLNLIKSYNNNSTSSTHWNEVVYTGQDFLDKMLQEKKGNVVVLAGNNGVKVDYILQSIKGGFNVFADKPMVIDAAGFIKLKEAFEAAQKNKLELYDIMTERYEITTMLQRALSMDTTLFGELQKGTAAEPAVTKESVHHYYKYVSGAVLTRPAWFLDVSQQGEGIVDVTTHLVDLVQWECFPEQALDYTRDIQ
ncbi:MAG TPA: putative oxidoreductase C-terminal domain-containing protein, partial [Sediminibacterium sp.]|nr:putative oxidoreductase C-terminal domain-containing protein [Sediminibacterium sp.]